MIELYALSSEYFVIILVIYYMLELAIHVDRVIEYMLVVKSYFTECLVFFY